ncbi:hypothetical protein PN36_20025 [Candidatus Thiomargarita nelsonii]|uniref:Uncharacterized protein n=1 Tax=Candidatus Thiomargarita nelsonii TaxID=1003181 RepID=A0A0A6P744_9GAMM|nr:hypothetical protein PN36_20025 [Candidatus Thiomargarita nelsonii]
MAFLLRKGTKKWWVLLLYPPDVVREYYSVHSAGGKLNQKFSGILCRVGRAKPTKSYRVGTRNMAQLDDLRANSLTEAGKDLWTTFVDEVNESLQPDLILVDAGTGLNQWGAFSLLRASDEAIVLGSVAFTGVLSPGNGFSRALSCPYIARLLSSQF